MPKTRSSPSEENAASAAAAEAQTYKTKSGKVLTEEDIEKLSEEAERGYDVSEFIERKDRSIYERMVAILAALPAIGKDTRNPQQGFMFRSHDAVLNALNPQLAKHGVFVVPDVLERVTSHRQTRQGGIMYEVNLHVRFTFYGAAGDSLQASTWGEGTDSGDKATNKAMTMAFKNVLAQTFAVSTEETIDSDALTPPETVKHVREQALDWIRPSGFTDVLYRLTEVQPPQEIWTKWWLPQFIEAAYGQGKRGTSDLNRDERELLLQQLTTTLYQLENLDVAFVEDQHVIEAFAVANKGTALLPPPAEGEKEWGLEATQDDQPGKTPEEEEIERLAEEVFSAEELPPEEAKEAWEQGKRLPDDTTESAT